MKKPMKGTRGISWGLLLTPGPRAVPEFPNGQSAPGHNLHTACQGMLETQKRWENKTKAFCCLDYHSAGLTGPRLGCC
ncbi:unnamed protein product, partial [Staurois parvus]